MQVQVSVRINLFELIYWHKHLWDSLRELIETSHDMFMIKLFASYFYELFKIAYENNL